MLVSRHHTRRVPTRCRGSVYTCRIRRKSGRTLIETLLVLTALVCVLIGTQSWYGSQPALSAGASQSSRVTEIELPPLCALDISPDQQEAAVVGLDGMLRFYDLRTRKCTAEVKSQAGESRSLCYSADGSQLLVGTTYGTVELWSFIGDHSTCRTLDAHPYEVTCCVFSPNGRSFLTCGNDRRCRLWDTETLQPLFELPANSAFVRQAFFNPDGTRLTTADFTGNIQEWDLSTRKSVKSFLVNDSSDGYKFRVVGLAPIHRKSQVLIATRNDGLSMWDLKTGSLLRRFHNLNRELICMSLSKDGRRAVTGSANEQIDVWDVATGKCLQTFSGHVGPVKAVKFADGHQLIVSVGWDGHHKFWGKDSSEVGQKRL